MSVYFNEARSRWQYDFQRNGVRHSGYCIGLDGKAVQSKRAALDAEARVKSSLKETKLQDAPQGFTLAEAFALWCEQRATKNRTWPMIRSRVAELLDFFGLAIEVERIGPSDIERYVEWARKQEVKRWTGGPSKEAPKFAPTGRYRSNAVINRYLDVLRATIRYAAKCRKVRSIVSIDRLEEPEAAPNPIQRSDVRKILEKAPWHLQRLILLCVHTGMRMNEATQLVWDQVDFGAKTIRLGIETKAKRGRLVHLNAVVIEILREIEAERPEGEARVLLYRHRGKGKPKPFDDAHRAWYSTLKACGLSGRYRFHDTRAAFCSLLAERGIDPVHIKDLAGHREISTTLRYIKPSDKRLQEAVKSLEDIGRGVAPPDLKIIARTA